MRLVDMLNVEESICKWLYDNEVKGDIVFTNKYGHEFIMLEYDAERILLRPLCTEIFFEKSELSIPLTELLKQNVFIMRVDNHETN